MDKETTPEVDSVQNSPKKYHTLSADVCPRISEDLFLFYPQQIPLRVKHCPHNINSLHHFTPTPLPPPLPPIVKCNVLLLQISRQI